MFNSRMNIESYDSFEFWFTRSPSREENFIDWEVYPLCTEDPKDSNIVKYFYNEADDTVYDSALRDIYDDVAIRIRNEFERFKDSRPEYLVGKPFELNIMSQGERINFYEHLLIGVAFIRSYRNGVNPDTSLSKIQHCIDWLRSGDFYSAPASTIYHESYHGGLLHHTLSVVNQIYDCIKLNKFSSVRIEDATLVALVHDWCKIGLYSSYNRNVKNDETGQWEQVLAYKRNDAALPLGHGVASMFLARRFFKLSTEESLAIRWHMSAWNCVNSEFNELQSANEKYPLVHLLQFADQLSITQY